MFWNRIANQNHFLDCICCAMVAIAARQGESSRLKIRKLSAAREVGKPCLYSLCNGYCIFCIASYICKNAHGGNDRFLCGKAGQRSCHRLPLAKAQRCTNKGAMKPPITASKLFPLSSTRPKPPFSKPNPPRNHITTQARNRIVPALMMKPFSLSHT